MIDEMTIRKATNEIVTIQGKLNDSEKYICTHNLTEILNDIFKEYCKIKECILTYNTDKPFFGTFVYTSIYPSYIKYIYFEPDKIKDMRNPFINVEIDSKLFGVGLDDLEIFSYILFDISSLVVNYTNNIMNVSQLINVCCSCQDGYLSQVEFYPHRALWTYAISDTLNRLTAAVYKDDISEIESNAFMNENNLTNTLTYGLMKARNSVYGPLTKLPYVTILKWVMWVMSNVKDHRITAAYTLREAKYATGSVYVKELIDKSIKGLAEYEGIKSYEESTIITEGFGKLKRVGLRSLEDDLYEFNLRVNNADTEDDAYYALQQINSRLGTLEDYIRYSKLDDAEYDHWMSVANDYRSLRKRLADKKVLDRKQYGLFYDYDALDGRR